MALRSAASRAMSARMAAIDSQERRQVRTGTGRGRRRGAISPRRHPILVAYLVLRPVKSFSERVASAWVGTIQKQPQARQTFDQLFVSPGAHQKALGAAKVGGRHVRPFRAVSCRWGEVRFTHHTRPQVAKGDFDEPCQPFGLTPGVPNRDGEECQPESEPRRIGIEISGNSKLERPGIAATREMGGPPWGRGGVGELAQVYNPVYIWIVRRPKNLPFQGAINWRRGRDSNPRYGFPYTHFPGVRLRPLGHPSATRVLARRARISPRAARAQVGAPRRRPAFAAWTGREALRKTRPLGPRAG